MQGKRVKVKECDTMTTTDCAKCGRVGGEIKITAEGRWVDAHDVAWFEQANGDSWCEVCEKERIARKAAAAILGRSGGLHKKHFSLTELALRRQRMLALAQVMRDRRAAKKAGLLTMVAQV